MTLQPFSYSFLFGHQTCLTALSCLVEWGVETERHTKIGFPLPDCCGCDHHIYHLLMALLWWSINKWKLLCNPIGALGSSSDDPHPAQSMFTPVHIRSYVRCVLIDQFGWYGLIILNDNVSNVGSKRRGQVSCPLNFWDSIPAVLLSIGPIRAPKNIHRSNSFLGWSFCAVDFVPLPI